MVELQVTATAERCLSTVEKTEEPELGHTEEIPRMSSTVIDARIIDVLERSKD